MHWEGRDIQSFVFHINLLGVFIYPKQQAGFVFSEVQVSYALILIYYKTRKKNERLASLSDETEVSVRQEMSL